MFEIANCSPWFILYNKNTFWIWDHCLNRIAIGGKEFRWRTCTEWCYPGRKAKPTRCSTLFTSCCKMLSQQLFLDTPLFSTLISCVFPLILYSSLHIIPAPSHSSGISSSYSTSFSLFPFIFQLEPAPITGKHCSEIMDWQHANPTVCLSVLTSPAPLKRINFWASSAVCPCTGQFLGATWRLMETEPLNQSSWKTKMKLKLLRVKESMG